MQTAFVVAAVAALSVSGTAQQLQTAGAVFEVASIKPASFPNEFYFEG